MKKKNLKKYKIQVIDKNKKEKNYYLRTYLIKVDKNSKQELQKVKKIDSYALKIKKSKKENGCQCFKTLKENKIPKNNNAFYIEQEALKDIYSPLYEKIVDSSFQYF